MQKERQASGGDERGFRSNVHWLGKYSFSGGYVHSNRIEKALVNSTSRRKLRFAFRVGFNFSFLNFQLIDQPMKVSPGDSQSPCALCFAPAALAQSPQDESALKAPDFQLVGKS